MDYFEQLIEFSGGTLDTEHEQELFNVLAQDEELRADFRSYLTMKTALGDRDGAAAFIPSVSSAAGIFSKVGLTLPQMLGGGLVGTAVGAGIKTGIWAKLGSLILASGITAAVAGMAVYFFTSANLKEGNDEYTARITALEKEKTQLERINGTLREENTRLVPMIAAAEKKAGDALPKTHIIYVTKPASEAEKEVSMTQTEKVQPVTSVNAFSHDISYSAVEIETFKKIAPIREERSAKPYQGGMMILPVESMQLDSDGSLLGLSLEFRASGARSMQKETVSPAEYADFNNTGLSLMYDLGGGFEVLADYRRETFFLKYNVVELNGDRFVYEQQPNFEIFGPGIRYSPVSLFGFIDPFVQVQMGWNSKEVGIVYRGMAGATVDLYRNVSFLLGLEYATMRYKQQGTDYTSDKAGINFGVRFKF